LSSENELGHSNDNCNMCGTPLPYYMRSSTSIPSVRVPHPVHPMMTVDKLLCSEKCKRKFIWGIREGERIHNLRINKLKRWLCRQKRKARYDRHNHVLYWKQSIVQIMVILGLIMVSPSSWYYTIYVVNCAILCIRGFLWVGNVYPEDKHPDYRGGCK